MSVDVIRLDLAGAEVLTGPELLDRMYAGAGLVGDGVAVVLGSGDDVAMVLAVGDGDEFLRFAEVVAAAAVNVAANRPAAAAGGPMPDVDESSRDRELARRRTCAGCGLVFAGDGGLRSHQSRPWAEVGCRP